jgi:hypothetical protein
MEEETAKAIKFLNGKGYTCMDNHPHQSSHVGVSARKKKMDYTIGAESAESYAASPMYQQKIKDTINALGGKKRSHKKRSHKKRSHKKRSHKKRS